MLQELIHYCASFPGTPGRFRRHLPDAVGIWARGRRQMAAWAPHTSRTAALIAATIPTLPSHRTAVVLGSGSLFDIPLEALSKAFKTVILVDRAHLATARRRARPLGNVHFIWRGLSIADTRRPLAFLEEIADLDWVLSINLVSQLAVGAPDGQERAVIDAHLDALAALPCPVTLATDLRYQLTNRAGAVIEDFDLLYGRSMPPGSAEWPWDVAPFGEEGRDTRRVHTVTFYPDWATASRYKTDIKSG